MIIVYIIIGIVLLIRELLVTIYLIRHSRKSSEKLIDNNRNKLQSCLSSKIQAIYNSLPVTNNFHIENQTNLEEKQPFVLVSQTLPLVTSSKVSLGQQNSTWNESFRKVTYQHDYNQFLELGSKLIDRPLGTGLQPLSFMGPILMKFEMCEQHWIRSNND